MLNVDICLSSTLIVYQSHGRQIVLCCFVLLFCPAPLTPLFSLDPPFVPRPREMLLRRELGIAINLINDVLPPEQQLRYIPWGE